jgi:hypothetical protein
MRAGEARRFQRCEMAGPIGDHAPDRWQQTVAPAQRRFGSSPKAKGGRRGPAAESLRPITASLPAA